MSFFVNQLGLIEMIVIASQIQNDNISLAWVNTTKYSKSQVLFLTHFLMRFLYSFIVIHCDYLNRDFYV